MIQIHFWILGSYSSSVNIISDVKIMVCVLYISCSVGVQKYMIYKVGSSCLPWKFFYPTSKLSCRKGIDFSGYVFYLQNSITAMILSSLTETCTNLLKKTAKRPKEVAIKNKIKIHTHTYQMWLQSIGEHHAHTHVKLQ